MKKIEKQSTIFDAARSGDVHAVRAFLKAGADPAAVDDYGFNALHHAAMGSNTTEVEAVDDTLILLISAGAPLEMASRDGTALYLAAEFSPSTQPVQTLLDAGANPDVVSSHGNHIVDNAMDEEVQALLSKVTRKYVLPKPEERAPLKLKPAQWKAVKVRIDAVFEGLNASGLVALQDAGTMQSDGFDDCSELFHTRGGRRAGLHGFCFYTRQDLNRAKQTSDLSLAFWGAPAGAKEDMQRVGNLVVKAFRAAGFIVEWSGSADMRPSVCLQAACD